MGSQTDVSYLKEVEMKLMKEILLLCLVLIFLSSCTAMSRFKTSPDYQAGRKAGESYAAEDSAEIKCGWPLEPTHGDGAIKARTYKGALGEQGRSPAFIRGFYYGYREVYSKRISTYCGI
jgi:hypothetical protein